MLPYRQLIVRNTHTAGVSKFLIQQLDDVLSNESTSIKALARRD